MPLVGPPRRPCSQTCRDAARHRPASPLARARKLSPVMGRPLAILLTLLLGGLVALQIPMNSQLGRHTGVLGAAFISTAFTATTLGLLMVLSGTAPAVGVIRDVPLLYVIGGGSIGVLLLSLTIVVLREL